MAAYLIKDTTKEERQRIVEESLGNISANCDGCMAGLADMYQDYIDGKKEIRDINMEFKFSLLWADISAWKKSQERCRRIRRMCMSELMRISCIMCWIMVRPEMLISGEDSGRP